MVVRLTTILKCKLRNLIWWNFPVYSVNTGDSCRTPPGQNIPEIAKYVILSLIIVMIAIIFELVLAPWYFWVSSFSLFRFIKLLAYVADHDHDYDQIEDKKYYVNLVENILINQELKIYNFRKNKHENKVYRKERKIIGWVGLYLCCSNPREVDEEWG